MWAALPYYYHDSDGIDYLTRELPSLFPDLCQLIELPHKTAGGRTVLGVQVGNARGSNVDMILLTGNVHARELGTAEHCAHFAYNICRAYQDEDELRCGNKVFSFAQIRTIIEGLNLIIVPCLNPDGRDHVFAGRASGDHEQMLWRGNRQLDGGPDCFGVDLNRNHDFLWDFPSHFQNSFSVDTTTRPCSASQTYRGSAPASEPEAKNLVWLMDRFTAIYAYLDFHAAFGAIVYPWGDDFSQTTDPTQNFANPAYDGVRDPDEDAYKEYMPAEDLATFQRLGRAFNSALNAVRGKEYGLSASIELGRVILSDPHGTSIAYRGTSGCNDDYAYSRHFVNAGKSKILAFTVEFGEPLTDDAATALGFQPSMYLEMPAIVEDLIAGTLGFCLETKASVPSEWQRLLLILIALLVAILAAIWASC